MPPLKEFAKLITLNMATLTTTYARILGENHTEYKEFSIEDRKNAARKLLKAVVKACELETSAPLSSLFNPPANNSQLLWPAKVCAPSPLAEIEALGQTLMPIAPNLVASKFLWQVLAEIRWSLSAQLAKSSLLSELPQVAAPHLATNHNKPQQQPKQPPSKEKVETVKTSKKYQNGQPADVIARQASIEQASARVNTNLSSLAPDKLQPTSAISLVMTFEIAQLEKNATLADLPVYAFQVDSGALVREVSKLLRTHTVLPGVIITHNQTAIGVISRRKFFEQLGQLYGVAVYMRRPINLVLKANDSEPLCLPAACSVPEALRQALSRPPGFVYEPVIVEYENQTYRLLDIHTLLMAQWKLFATLQSELQQANNELEDRVEERTAELVKVNDNLREEIAKRKQIEAELISARDQALAASRLKSELLAKVSHELRTPLGAILGYTEMIQVGFFGPISDEQAETTVKIINSTNYLTSLVNQLLDQGQYEAGKLSLDISLFSPGQIIEDMVLKLGVVAKNKGLALITGIAPDLSTELLGDPVRLQQILVNLVSNAIKFTDEGSVEVRLYRLDFNRWVMQVSDTGRGIPAEAQSQIFEPFGQADGSATRQHAGVGLGLSIVKQLTTLMGGQIQLKSEVGQGSTFKIILPLQIEEMVRA